jgi:coenzyme F420-0:L-glutamate ligase/coenzyme F420-1:gamma-L-glutamate ligase
MQSTNVKLSAVPGIPLIEPGDDLADVFAGCLQRADIVPRDQDVLVIAQKIVSKAEGRYVDLNDITPSPRAIRLAATVGKDPRLIELTLAESREVMRYRQGVLIVEHRLGFVMANAGIDQSNIEHPAGRDFALLLPEDPDASCARLKARLDRAFNADLGIVINDSFGRPWRNGVVGVALGSAGLPALLDMVGSPDLYGRAMRITEIAFADEIAAAASMLMGQTDAGMPLIHLRGLRWDAPARNAAALLRPKQLDMFR